MQEQEKNTSISLDEYIKRQIAGYIEIINKAQGAIEALTEMQANTVKQDEQTQKGQKDEKKDTGAGRGGRAVPATGAGAGSNGTRANAGK